MGYQSDTVKEKYEQIKQYLIDTDLITTCVNYQAKNGTKDYENKDDIIQDCWLWILTYDFENDYKKLFDAYDKNHMNALITTYLKRQLFSTQSPHYAKYHRYKDRTTEITQDVLELPDNYDFRGRAQRHTERTEGSTEGTED